MGVVDARRASSGTGGGALPGPFPVGAYAAALKRRLREFARVELVGEIWGIRASRARVYFELRDGAGALPCSMWREDFETLGILRAEGTRVVAAGGCDYYAGSAASSPSFAFAVIGLRLAGDGDLLVQLERLRRRLDAEGLLARQKRLRRPALPRAIGVVTAEEGKARADVVAALHRRSWGGRLVWAFAPVQDRHAAPLMTAVLRDLAAIDEVEIVIVARGGGSLADLFAFSDETLCRTVAMLPLPVISSVGHHTDHTLIDDVAAVSCSTPTHAAEAAVPIDGRRARAELEASARALRRHGQRAILDRVRNLEHLARAPTQHLERHRRHVHQLARELRASSHRAAQHRRAGTARQLEHLARCSRRAGAGEAARRAGELDRLLMALTAHDPARTLARGYSLAQTRDGEPIVSAAAAAERREFDLRFRDGVLGVRVHVAEEENG